jgi:hypothetical protein
MRKAFETAQRDGKVVILEDDASGTYEAARWSAEAGEWVGEDGAKQDHADALVSI